MRERGDDLLVVGAGLAGLYAALHAAARGARVVLVTKGSLRASTSFHAQGGIAAAVGDGDSPADHAADTLRVGRGLCSPEAVAILTEEARPRIADLERLGVAFDHEPSGVPSLGREGGHSRNRVLHAGGAATGAAVAEALLARLAQSPGVRVLEHASAIQLISDDASCAGAWVLGHDELVPVRARATLLATGGAAALYARTTNPAGAIGDGIALAARAGAAVADMEFVQFHPTALAVGGERAFLISEAVRGHGAHLVDADGDRFMPAVHPDAELAPRDVVAQEIDRRRAQGGEVFLSLSHLDAARIRAAFPNLVAGCAAAGYDLTSDPVPVSPAAHYLMGGVETGLDGASSLRGLYAAGECASTGVHGANRLASNSLLECFVFGHRAVEAALHAEAPGTADGPPPDGPLVRADLPTLRMLMWRDAGLARDAAGLERVLDWLAGQPRTNPILVARLIAEAALARTESRGAHLRTDHPQEDPAQCRRQRSRIAISAC
jgi:L-aspartate oxidase